MRLLAVLFAGFLAVACESAGPAPLNINQATVAELEALPGIGAARARSIIASRNAHGGQFTTFDEILKIDGIGPQTVDRLRAYVVLGPKRTR